MIVTGGGTAGHVTPLLAVVTELHKRHPEVQIRYIGQYGDSMQNIVKEQGNIDRRYRILAGKWRRYHGLSVVGHLADIKTLAKNFRDAVLFTLGYVQSIFILLFWRPKVVFAKGGFVCLPVGLAAATLRIPVITHDSDSIPGLTNRILSRFARLQATGMPTTFYKDFYQLEKLRYTGIPVMADFDNVASDTFKHQSRLFFKIPNDAKVVAVIGGSLGAVRLNDAILANLRSLTDDYINLIWVTGAKQYKELVEKSGQLVERKAFLKMFAFSSDMPKIIAAADIVISRAGATSIAELALAAKPVILVPSPYLVGGHQVKNAVNLEKSNAVIVVTEHQIEKDASIVGNTVGSLFSDESKRAELSKNIYKLAVKDASAKIADVIEEVLAK